MRLIQKNYTIEEYHFDDDGRFPNNTLPVLVYKSVLTLPLFFAAQYIKTVFKRNNWLNTWKDTVYDYHHYHSNTHEVLGVFQGRTTLQFGGPKGKKVPVKKGDVILIPAGVAHKNLEPKNEFKCVGAYPNGHDFDLNLGKKSERPEADEHLAKVKKPATDPVFGKKGKLKSYWK